MDLFKKNEAGAAGGGGSGTTFLVGAEKPHAVYEKTKPYAEKGS